MTLQTRALGILGAMTFVATLAVAADPFVISPLAQPNGIAPNGIDATPAGIRFTQPYADGLQARGVYSITTGGTVALVGSIPTVGGVSAENGIAIVTSPAFSSGFTPGDTFATGVSTTDSTKDAIYKIGSGTPFINNLSATLSQHQSTVYFDKIGSFNGALIVIHDQTVDLYNSTPTLIATYTIPVTSSAFVFQAATVAPIGYAACSGCIFVTAMLSVNINNPTTTCCGQILTISWRRERNRGGPLCHDHWNPRAGVNSVRNE